MNIISKIGQRDNVVTYEHICDTRADMSKIEPRYITLGSTCIVLQGKSGMEVYMADSGREWHDLLLSSGDSQASGDLYDDLNEVLATKLTYGGSVASANMLVDDGIISADAAMEKPGAIKLMFQDYEIAITLQNSNDNFIPLEVYDDRGSNFYYLFTDLDNGTYTLKSQWDNVYFYLRDENGNQIAENVQECQLVVNNDSRVYIISETDLSAEGQEESF